MIFSSSLNDCVISVAIDTGLSFCLKARKELKRILKVIFTKHNQAEELHQVLEEELEDKLTDFPSSVVSL